MTTKRLSLAALACVFTFAMSTPASATAILDFGTASAGAGGTVSYDGGLTSSLVGEDIRIGALIAYDTPENTLPVLDVTSNQTSYGVLNFETGAYLGYSSGIYSFGSGGYFEIIGNVVDAGVTGTETSQGDSLITGALLLTGTFTSVQIFAGTGLAVFYATGFDVKNPDLLEYYGLAADTMFIMSGFSTSFTGLATGGAFEGITISTDITNVAAVPEPASLVLLGSGLTIVGSIIRRRRGRAAL